MLFLTAVLITILSAVKKGTFVDHTQILPELLHPPREYRTFTREFFFSYKGSEYKVEPLKNYELYGLVVSQNDLSSLLDVVQGEGFVDSRDVAVIWGENLRSNDFRKVKYNNTSTRVHWQHRRGVTFDPECISNNHLITDNKRIRDLISKVHIGDQIYIKGWLVNYQNVNVSGYWRKSSLSRSDLGDGACEVVFVKELKILTQATPGWYKLYDYGWRGIIIIPLIMLVISVLRTLVEARKLRHKHDRPYPEIPE